MRMAQPTYRRSIKHLLCMQMASATRGGAFDRNVIEMRSRSDVNIPVYAVHLGWWSVKLAKNADFAQVGLIRALSLRVLDRQNAASGC